MSANVCRPWMISRSGFEHTCAGRPSRLKYSHVYLHPRFPIPGWQPFSAVRPGSIAAGIIAPFRLRASGINFRCSGLLHRRTSAAGQTRPDPQKPPVRPVPATSPPLLAWMDEVASEIPKRAWPAGQPIANPAIGLFEASLPRNGREACASASLAKCSARYVPSR